MPFQELDPRELPSPTSPLTVTQLTQAIKSQLESGFPHVRVEGEISNFKPHSSGHYYFDLKDAEAKIPVVFFRAKQQPLPRPPKEGDRVVLVGSLTVYPPHGRYQFIVKEMHFAGLGDLLLKFEALKAKLQKLGWFDAKHKQPLPSFPKRIGVVTSPTGAVLRDMIHILRRRSPGFHLILNPVLVQGEGAAQQITQAIQDFNRYQLADVLIIGRGGGSLEDLWAFNEESVAQAIFESKIPIISAVGHETDVTLSDFVADVRAPTPSAAAEMVLSEKTRHLKQLSEGRTRLDHLLRQLLERRQRELAALKRHPLIAIPLSLLHIPYQRLDGFKTQLERVWQRAVTLKKLHLQERLKALRWLNPLVQLQQKKELLRRQDELLQRCLQQRLAFQKERLSRLMQQLSSLDPRNVLKRGYAILFDEKVNSVIASTEDLTPQAVVKALLSDGQATMVVTHISPGKSQKVTACE